MFGKVQSTRSAAAFSPHLNLNPDWPSSSAQKDANSKGNLSPPTRDTSTFPTSSGQTQTSAPISITSLDAYTPSALTQSQSVRTTATLTLAPTHPSFPRSNFSPKVSSTLVPPRSVVAPPATTSSPAASTSQLTTGSEPTGSSNSSELLALPERVATSPTTEPPAFTSSGGSKPSSDISPTKQLIVELAATAAYLDGQYNQYIRGVHLSIQNQLFPFTQSLADEAHSAKKELKQLLEQIATVDKDCSKFAVLYQDKCDKLEQAELALEKAQRVVEKTEKEHAALQGEVRKIQWGAMMNGAWVKRDPQALQQDATPPRPAADEGRGECPAALSSPQRAKKAIKSWDPQWEPIIALGRHSFTSQESVVSTDSGRQGNEGCVRDADQATTSDDYNGRPLLSGQLDTYSLPLASEDSVHSYEHA